MSKREIKFRAWDTTENKMLDSERVMFFDLLTVNGEGSIYRFMQYIGLKDANDNDIYEGDILKPTGRSVQKENRLVQYIDGGFCYELSSYPSTRGQYSQLGRARANLFEVVGNIYETPKLYKSDPLQSK